MTSTGCIPSHKEQRKVIFILLETSKTSDFLNSQILEHVYHSMTCTYHTYHIYIRSWLLYLCSRIYMYIYIYTYTLCHEVIKKIPTMDSMAKTKH